MYTHIIVFVRRLPVWRRRRLHGGRSLRLEFTRLAETRLAQNTLNYL